MGALIFDVGLGIRRMLVIFAFFNNFPISERKIVTP